MNIATICPHYGFFNRGTEVMTSTINRILRERKHHVDVFSLYKEADVRISGLQRNYGMGRVSYLFADRSMFGSFLKKYIGITPHIEDIAFSLRTYPVLKDAHGSYDVLWSNGEYWEASMLRKLRKATGKPTLSFFGGGISKMMEREARLYPDIFVVLTPSMKDWVKERVPGCNVVFIPTGVDLKKFDSAETVVLPDEVKKLERPIYLSTASLSSEKRVELIVDAVSRLEKGSLIITSSGPNKEKILSQCEKKLKGRYWYAGVLPDSSLVSIYKFSDVCISASRSEGFSASILEALAANKPVVGHKDENRIFEIEKAGVLVDVTDPKAFTEALQKAAETNFGNTPRSQAEKYSIERTVDRYEEEIGKVLQERGHSL